MNLVSGNNRATQDNQCDALPHDDLEHAFDVVGVRWEKLRGKRIFVTGGTGFVGKWLLAALLHARRRLSLDCTVRVLTRDPEAFRRAVPTLANAAGIELQKGDAKLLSATGQRSFNIVIHAATDAVTNGDPLQTFDTCVLGTRRALDFARAVGASDVLLMSSGAVYGKQPLSMDTIDENFVGAPDTMNSASAYGEGKRAAEWLASAYAEAHGLRVKAARCFAFVGPFLPLDRHFAVGNFLSDAMARRPIVIRGDGTPLRSYLHASDMAAWLWAIAIDGRSQVAYNVGSSEAISIRQLADFVLHATGSTEGVRVHAIATAGATPERYVPDNRRVMQELELPAPLGLAESIHRTVQWHLTERADNQERLNRLPE